MLGMMRFQTECTRHILLDSDCTSGRGTALHFLCFITDFPLAGGRDILLDFSGQPTAARAPTSLASPYIYHRGDAPSKHRDSHGDTQRENDRSYYHT